MRRTHLVAAAFAALLACSGLAAQAQSPGSAASELKYAREYMEAGKYDYAQWRYEGILLKDPDNAEAQAGLAEAKSRRAALDARRTGGGSTGSGPTSEQMATPKGGYSPSSADRSTPAATGAQAECDRLFGSCWVSSKSPSCFTQKTLCYRRNGIQD